MDVFLNPVSVSGEINSSAELQAFSLFAVFFDTPSLMPDIEVALFAEGYFAARDPFLNSALAYEVEQSTTTFRMEKLRSEIT